MLKKVNKIVAAVFWSSLVPLSVILFLTISAYLTAQEQLSLAQSFQLALSELNPFSQDFLDIRVYAAWGLRIAVLLAALSFLISMITYFQSREGKRIKRGVVVLLFGGGIFLFYHTGFRGLYLDTVMDDKGVEIYYYGYQKHHHVGFQRNPLFIASQAMNYHQDYKNGEEPNLDRFDNTIDWLVENRVVDGEASYFLYDFEILDYQMKPPWKSGLANSRAILAFLEAHKVYGDQQYLDYAHSCVFPYTISVDDGGFLVELSDESYWYAEYPRMDGTTPMVLNGMMSILLAMEGYQKYAPNSLTEGLLKKGLKGLKEKLAEFDKDGASLYDLKGRDASKSYHILHISLLNQLYEVTGDEFFLKYHDKWRTYAVKQRWI